jgi:hypothetical protein
LVPSADLRSYMKRFNPIMPSGEKVFVLLTQSIAAVPVTPLGPQMTRLEHLPDKISRALGFLFHGV